MTRYEKPLPEATDLTRPFWKAAKEGKLLVQRCCDCGERIFYPRNICTNCMSSNLDWMQVEGQGKVHTFTIVHYAPFPSFQNDVPYVLAVIELNEGPRMLTNIVGCSPDKVEIGMEVEVVFDHVTEKIAIPKFRPVTREKRG